MSISDRLNERIDHRFRSIREFQKAVEEVATEGMRGISYGSVYQYVKGGLEPPLSFLRPAADVLGVKLGWLITGEGPRTDDEERVTRYEHLGPGSLVVDEPLESMGWTPGTRALFHEAWRRYVAAARDDHLTDDDMLALGATLLLVILDMRKVWGFQHEMSGRQLNDYVTAMAQALMLAMPDEGEGDHLKDRGTLFPMTLGGSVRLAASEGEPKEATEE